MTIPEGLNNFAQICCEKNAVLRDCFTHGDMTLSEMLDVQAYKVRKNQDITPLCNPEDFFSRAKNFAGERVGFELAEKVDSAFRLGAACTADHHGGLYCAQSFQGDILFSFLLEKLGCHSSIVPILSAGQVELENSSYARGICTYMSKDSRQFFPIFPSKYSVRLASYTEPFNQEMLNRFRQCFICDSNSDENILSELLDKILKEAYENESVLSSECFSDQTPKIGAKLTQNMFTDGEKIFIYLEMESLIMPLLINELNDKHSLISRLCFESSTVREYMLDEKFSDGTPLASLLFWGADEKGRKLHLTLLPEGELEGRDWRGQSIRYKADSSSLIKLLTERRIFPGVFTIALLTFFERGITWLGGMFQSHYLPVQQQALVNILNKAGLKHESEIIGSYDCSGYISGPVFFLYDGKGFSTPEGPVEAFRDKPSLIRLRELTQSTNLRDAHLMGLADIYFDLIPRKLRNENWYSIIAESLYNQYQGNRIQAL